MMIMMIDIITILVSVQNARVSSNAHPNRASTPHSTLGFGHASLLSKKHQRQHATHTIRRHTHEKKRETKTMMKMMRERGKKRKTNKKRR